MANAAQKDQTENLFQKAGEYIRAGQLEKAEGLLLDLAGVNGAEAEAYSKLGVVYNFKEDPKKAITFFLKSLEADESYVPAYHNLCLAHMKGGVYDRAIEYGEQGLVYNPEFLELYYALAFSARLKGDLDGSVGYMKQALAYDENNIRSLANYAPLLFEKGQDEEALGLIQKIIAANPEQGFVMAKEYMATSQFERAELILEKLIAADAFPDEAYTRLGVIYNAQNRKDEAIELFLKALEINEKFVPAYHNLCLAYTDAAAFEKAIDYGSKGLFIDPSFLELYYAVALAFRGQGKLVKGLGYLRQALAHDEHNVRTLTNYAALLFEKGDKAKARQALKKIIELEPENGSAHRMLSLIEKYKAGDSYIMQMEEVLAVGTLAPHVQSEMHFALGKAYESAKDYGESFRHYKQANALHRQSLQYCIEKEKAFFEDIKKVFTKDFIAKNAVLGSYSKTPVFILGMPRSSTSLVEQILASHPEVYGAGELRDLGVIQFQNYDITLRNFVEVYESLQDSDFKAMANSYSQKLESLAPNHPYVTDKMPMNFRFIGLISCLFPKAKIIHCIRDPRDTCLSIFKTYFTGNLPYAYDEGEIAAYYKIYEDLMAHWHEVLPDKIYDVRYEDLVGEPERHIREILGYCGLEWDDACLDFHKTERSVTTASAMQVKQPLYKTALGYWQNFEPYMSDDIKNLAD